jgi:hypothetical protein
MLSGASYLLGRRQASSLETPERAG